MLPSGSSRHVCATPLTIDLTQAEVSALSAVDSTTVVGSASAAGVDERAWIPASADGTASKEAELSVVWPHPAESRAKTERRTRTGPTNLVGWQSYSPVCMWTFCGIGRERVGLRRPISSWWAARTL